MSNFFCGLCAEVSGRASPEFGEGYGRLVRSRKNVLAETANLLLVPSVGPLNDSHVMIVPKQHVNSFACLDKGGVAESQQLIARLQDYALSRLGRRLIFFESGAGRLTDHSGGCVTHAHIHCVSESGSFHQRLFTEVRLVLATDSGYSEADKEHGYLWYEDADGQRYLCNRPLLPSQFLRYLYAQCEGNMGMWNWRRHANFDGILLVVENYREFSKSPA